VPAVGCRTGAGSDFFDFDINSLDDLFEQPGGESIGPAVFDKLAIPIIISDDALFCA